MRYKLDPRYRPELFGGNACANASVSYNCTLCKFEGGCAYNSAAQSWWCHMLLHRLVSFVATPQSARIGTRVQGVHLAREMSWERISRGSFRHRTLSPVSRGARVVSTSTAECIPV